MAFWEAAFTGSYGGAYRLRVQADVIAQEQGNNRSLVRYNAWVEQVGGSAYSVNNPSASGSTNKNGQVDGRGGGISLNGAGQRKYLAQNEDLWVYHNGSGDATAYFDAGWDMKLSSYGYGTASTGGTMGMPHINRYANITAFYFATVTDTLITFNWNADATCDYVSWWSPQIEGGAHHDIPVSGAGTFSISRDNLASGTYYEVRVAVRRADSGLWTESGTISTTTGAQNNFFDMSGM